MKRIVNILGLKDKEGNYYVFNEHENPDDNNFTKLSDESFTLANQVILFPYNTFDICSVFDKEQYEWTILEVLMDFEDDNEYYQLYYYSYESAYDEKNYKYENRNVLLLDEVLSPYKIAWNHIKKFVQKKQKSLQNIIEAGILYEQIRYGFKSDEDIKYFINIFKYFQARSHYELPVSRFNVKYLNDFAPYKIKLNTRWSYNTSSFKLSLSDCEYLNKEQLEEWIWLEHKDIDDIMPHMNQSAIKEYGVENLLKAMLPHISHLVEKNGYLPEDYHSSQEEDINTYNYDLREVEAE